MQLKKIPKVVALSNFNYSIQRFRQIVIASLTDNIARRVDPISTDSVPKGAYQSQKLKVLFPDISSLLLFIHLEVERNFKYISNLQDYVYIDPSSILFKDEPDWVLYQEIIEVCCRHIYPKRFAKQNEN